MNTFGDACPRDTYCGTATQVVPTDVSNPRRAGRAVPTTTVPYIDVALRLRTFITARADLPALKCLIIQCFSLVWRVDSWPLFSFCAGKFR